MKNFIKSIISEIGTAGSVVIALFLVVVVFGIIQATFLSPLITAVGVFDIFGLRATAATTNIAATVTPQNISLTVSPTSVAYGNVALSSTKSTTQVSSSITVNNNGNVTEDISGTSTDATGGSTPWNLAAAAGSDAYAHNFSINDGAAWTTFNVDNTTYATIKSGLTSTASTTLDLLIWTPTTSTVYDAKSITVSLQALGQ